MLMLRSWRSDPSYKSERNEGPMNGEGCDLSVPSPALAGYLGNVSCVLFSPTVTCAKLLIKHAQIGSCIGQTILTQIIYKIIKYKEILVKGESYRKVKLCTSCCDNSKLLLPKKCFGSVNGFTVF